MAKGFPVERVEYLNQLPALWPILERPTAFILDLRDPKYNLFDKDGDLYRVDALVKNKVSIYFSVLHAMTYYVYFNLSGPGFIPHDNGNQRQPSNGHISSRICSHTVSTSTREV